MREQTAYLPKITEAKNALESTKSTIDFGVIIARSIREETIAARERGDISTALTGQIMAETIHVYAIHPLIRTMQTQAVAVSTLIHAHAAQGI